MPSGFETRKVRIVVIGCKGRVKTGMFLNHEGTKDTKGLELENTS
jgi:hypothetical protein